MPVLLRVSLIIILLWTPPLFDAEAVIHADGYIFYHSEIKNLELRCCIEPVRKVDGTIARNRSVIERFRKRFPCPTGAKHNESCEGWAVDHVIPLACGGRDIVSNLQWLPDEIKSTDNPNAKDRWERDIYCK